MFKRTLAERVLKGLAKELETRVQWAKEDVERYSEQLNAVDKAIEELKRAKR